jgi:diaminopimelate epimerase
VSGIPFVKAVACGNDFLIVDAVYMKDDPSESTRRLCDRHEGVGADGVEWVSSDPQANVRARLLNADGSFAEVSGNGTRCVAAWYSAEHGRDLVMVRTDAGVKSCTLVGREGPNFDFDTAMGAPEAGEAFTIRLAFGNITGLPVSMGNPHFVVFMDRFKAGWQAEAAEIGQHHDFTSGTNVEFVRVTDQHNLDVRFFERGAGETKSSGTGSCASAVAAIVSGRVKSPVNVHAEGGMQIVRWEGEVYLRGAAQLVCRGEFFI